MKKRKSNREIIESENPEVEHSYIKFPRESLISVTENSDYDRVKSDLGKIDKMARKKGKEYLHLHTHPYISFDDSYGSALPSPPDLFNFNNSHREKTMAIVTRDSSGKVIGSTMVFRSDKNYKSPEENISAIKAYRNAVAVSGFNEEIDILNKLEEALKTIKWGIRFHPAQGYYFNRETLRYEKGRGSLEGVVGSILIGFLFLFLLIKIPINGFAISNFISSDYQIGFFILFGLFLSLLVYFILKPYKKI